MTRNIKTIGLLMLAIILVTVGCGVIPSSDQPEVRTVLITLEVIVTATPDPNATPNVLIVTATSDRTQVTVPDDVVQEVDAPDDDEDSDSTATGATAIEVDAQAQALEQLPPQCVTHIVDSGESVFGIAEQYEVSGFLVLQVNNLTEDTAVDLQIGDRLIVPLEGCPIEAVTEITRPTDVPTFTPSPTATLTPTETPDGPTETPTPSITPTSRFTATPTVTPTITLPPTAEDSSVEIRIVEGVGDITLENVSITNTSPDLIQMSGWTLTDSQDNEYEFGSLLLFGQTEIQVFTSGGTSTPIILYWGLEEPIWEPGDVVTLRDDDGDIQAVYRIPQDIDLD